MRWSRIAINWRVLISFHVLIALILRLSSHRFWHRTVPYTHSEFSEWKLPSLSEMEKTNTSSCFSLYEIQTFYILYCRNWSILKIFYERNSSLFFPRRQWGISDKLLKPTFICKCRHCFWQNPWGSLWVPSDLCHRLKQPKLVVSCIHQFVNSYYILITVAWNLLFWITVGFITPLIHNEKHISSLKNVLCLYIIIIVIIIINCNWVVTR